MEYITRAKKIWKFELSSQNRIAITVPTATFGITNWTTDEIKKIY